MSPVGHAAIGDPVFYFLSPDSPVTVGRVLKAGLENDFGEPFNIRFEIGIHGLRHGPRQQSSNNGGPAWWTGVIDGVIPYSLRNWINENHSRKHLVAVRKFDKEYVSRGFNKDNESFGILCLRCHSEVRVKSYVKVLSDLLVSPGKFRQGSLFAHRSDLEPNVISAQLCCNCREPDLPPYECCRELCL